MVVDAYTLSRDSAILGEHTVSTVFSRCSTLVARIKCKLRAEKLWPFEFDPQNYFHRVESLGPRAWANMGQRCCNPSHHLAHRADSVSLRLFALVLQTPTAMQAIKALRELFPLFKLYIPSNLMFCCGVSQLLIVEHTPSVLSLFFVSIMERFVYRLVIAWWSCRYDKSVYLDRLQQRPLRSAHMPGQVVVVLSASVLFLCWR